MSTTFPNETYEKAVRKMFEIGCHDFDSCDFSEKNSYKDEWYYTHTWSEQQEQEFKQWLTLFLVNKKNMRNISGHGYSNKKTRVRTVALFLLQHGFRIHKEVR
jgi:hypothetical protein